MEIVLQPSILEAMRVTPVSSLRQGSAKHRPRSNKGTADKRSTEKWTAPATVARGQLIDLVV